MREVTYTDPDGRRWRRLLPDGVSDSEAERGVPAGPPPTLDRLNLPLAVEVRLHNELHSRGLFTARDIRGRMTEVKHAIMAALTVDAQAVEACYTVPTPADEPTPTLTTEAVQA